MSLGTTLGELSLLRHGLRTALAGIAAAMAISVAIGVLLQVNPATPEIAPGETLAISIPRTEAAVVRHFQERMPYGLFVPDEYADGGFGVP